MGKHTRAEPEKIGKHRRPEPGASSTATQEQAPADLAQKKDFNESAQEITQEKQPQEFRPRGRRPAPVPDKPLNAEAKRIMNVVEQGGAATTAMLGWAMRSDQNEQLAKFLLNAGAEPDEALWKYAVTENPFTLSGSPERNIPDWFNVLLAADRKLPGGLLDYAVEQRLFRKAQALFLAGQTPSRKSAHAVKKRLPNTSLAIAFEASSKAKKTSPLSFLRRRRQKTSAPSAV